MQAILDNPSPREGELLPDEVLALEEQKKLQTLDKLEAFGLTMARKRTEAINARRNSGIENDWAEDIDAYNGMDDANREDPGWQKPLSPDGVLTTAPRGREVRSTVFVNITRPYVDAAAAKIADMLMPTDDRNWSIQPTPMPELSALVKKSLKQVPQLPAPQQPPQGMPPGMPGMPPQQPQMDPMAQQVQQAMAILDEASKRAEKAEKQIEDWLIECQYHAEMRKVIEDAAKIGTGILKGPFPVKKKRRAFKTDQGMAQLEIVEEIKPSCRRIDPQNFFPDGSCGEDIHNGSHCWERDFITGRQLKELIGLPGYVESQIAMVLEEGPQKKVADGFKEKNDYSDKDKFEIWYCHTFAEREDLEMIGVKVPDGQVPTIPSMITMVNDRVIKGAMNPLDSGEFPYRLFPWQRRPNMPWGMGVGRQGRTPQRMLNAATRNLLDNAGLSAGPQIVVKRGAITPADGNWSITPRKIWYLKNESDVQSVRDAFQIYSIDTRQAELSNIIQFAMKLMEDSTGLPQLLQGQQGQAPDTVGGMQMLSSNASSVLRRLARTFDDCITEPFISSMYAWLMLDPDIGDDAKGDFVIDARGSTSLVERDIQNQELMAMGQMVMNPAFGLSPERWIIEYLKSRRFDPKKFQLSDEEKSKMEQRQPPEAPQVTAAKIRADVEMQKAKIDTDRDHTYVAAETERSRSEHQARMAELEVKRELEIMKYANSRQENLESIKAKLADRAMSLRVQRELAMASNIVKAKQVTSPPTEPPGRAAPGMAFQQ